MTGKPYRVLIYALLAIFAVTLVAPLTAAPTAGKDQKTKEYKSKLGSVKSRISDVKKKIAVTKKKQRIVTGQLYVTQKKLQDTRKDLGYTRNRLQTARVQLGGINRELKTAESKLYAKRTALTERLTDAYKNPPPSYVMTLLTAGDTFTALTRGKMVQEVLEQDRTMISDIRKLRADIQLKQSRQKQKISQIGTLQKELSGQEQTEKELAWQKQAQLKDIVKDRRAYEAHLDSLVRESRRVESMIRALQNTTAGKKRMATAFRGGFIKPVNGPVTSPYGMRFHPILKKRKLHTGVDFGAKTGTSIKAAAAGTVIISGWMGAYGNAVVIDHGGGVSTLYGHCSSLGVKVGRQVKQGDIIGKVGSTGWSTGPHLHFEIRRNGTPVNPMQF